MWWCLGARAPARLPSSFTWWSRAASARGRDSFKVSAREMENISRGSTFGDFVTLRTEASMQDVTVARLQRVQEYRLPSPPSFKCNVLRESLSVDSQNIPCATLKRGGRVCISLVSANIFHSHLSLLLKYGPCNDFSNSECRCYIPSSVADPGCLSRIRILSIPDPGSKRSRIRIRTLLPNPPLKKSQSIVYFVRNRAVA